MTSEKLIRAIDDIVLEVLSGVVEFDDGIKKIAELLATYRPQLKFT